MDADQAYQLILFYILWLSQYVLVYSLIVIEVNLLYMQHLLSFLELLPEMLGLIKYKETCSTLLFSIQQWVYKVLYLYLLCAVINLELICKFIETIKMIINDPITIKRGSVLSYHL